MLNKPFRVKSLRKRVCRGPNLKLGLRYRLSHGMSFKDSLIASICYRLQIPIDTRNTKDFVILLPAQLVIKPY